jgi:hypothetical protein
MAIAVRCEACRIEAIADAPNELHAFLQRHRDPDLCAERVRRRTEPVVWLSIPLPQSA